MQQNNHCIFSFDVYFVAQVIYKHRAFVNDTKQVRRGGKRFCDASYKSVSEKVTQCDRGSEVQKKSKFV